MRLRERYCVLPDFRVRSFGIPAGRAGWWIVLRRRAAMPDELLLVRRVPAGCSPAASRLRLQFLSYSEAEIQPAFRARTR